MYTSELKMEKNKTEMTKIYIHSVSNVKVMFIFLKMEYYLTVMRVQMD